MNGWSLQTLWACPVEYRNVIIEEIQREANDRPGGGHIDMDALIARERRRRGLEPEWIEWADDAE